MSIVFVLVAQAAMASCSSADLAALGRVAQAMRAGDSSLQDRLDGDCAEITLARLALQGWADARALAPEGGPVVLLGPVHGTIDRLAAFKNSELDLEAQYAQTAIRAAIAAAQDERPEMELLLDHARDLSERLARRGRRAVWPRPFNLLAGELWFEVDRFETARLAFERAVKSDPSPIALVGLARAYARLENRPEACRTYARVQNAASALAEEARAFSSNCP